MACRSAPIKAISDTTLRTGGHLGESGDFRFTYQEKNDSGFTDQFDWKDSFNSRLVNLNAGFWLSNSDQLQLSLGHIEATTVQGRLDTAKDANGDKYLSGGDDPGNPLRDFDQSNTFFQAVWRRTLSEGSDFQLRYSYSEDRGSDAHVERNDDLTWNGNHDLLYKVDAYGDVGTRHEIEAQHTFSPFDATRLVWGAGYRLDSLKSDDFLYGQGTVYRRVGRLFGNLEWKPAEWFTGNLGGASEYDSLGGRNFSPRMSLNFHLNSENTVRFGASRAYRTGSTVDYVGHSVLTPYSTASGTPIPAGQVYEQQFYGDPDMEQEQINTIEIGYLGDWKNLRSSLDIRWFRERIPNRMLTMTRNLPSSICNVSVYPGTCTAADADFTTAIQKVRIEGVEFQWRWQPFDSTRLMIGQAWTEVYADFLDSVLPGSGVTTLLKDFNYEKLDLQTKRSTPSSASSFLWMQRLPGGLDFSLAGYWVGPMQWTRNSSVDFYRRFDARLGYPFNVGGQRGEIAYTAQSINGDHGEFKASGQPSDRVVELRHWLTLRVEL